MPSHQEISNFIWNIADLLRGPYRPPQYERVMLPLTVLRRFDCVLEKTKAQVVAAHNQRGDEAPDSFYDNLAGQRFHNHSALSFERLKSDPDNIQVHLKQYIHSFSQNVQDIFNKFDFDKEIEKMHDANILYLIVQQFAGLDLHPDVVDNMQMGLLFEDLIRRFNEQANETAGDYFTPRDVVHLLVDVLLAPDDDVLQRPGMAIKVLDPTCGTGGMLAEVQRHVAAYNRDAYVYVYGQEINPRAYAIAAADQLIKADPVGSPGQARTARKHSLESDIKYGDTLMNDQFEGQKFDYFLANPPYGVDWKRQQPYIKNEHEKQRDAGRFGAGMPRVSDGSLLFLQHMLHKMQPYQPDAPPGQQGGSRLAVVFSGSPLFSGGAGSGESDIRRWLIEEHDWLESIIALPDQLFYNTSIATYVWVLSNRKPPERQGKIQLLDIRELALPMRPTLGSKRRKIGEGKGENEPDQVAQIVKLYADFAPNHYSRIFPRETFGYLRLTVERPLRLRFQLTLERKARFLEACPYLLDDVQALDKSLGREPALNWNAVWHTAQAVLAERGSKWRAPEVKLFRAVCTERDPTAECVQLSSAKPLRGELSTTERHAGWFAVAEVTDGLFAEADTRPNRKVRYEPDADLRDFENVPLLGPDPDTYFAQEVLPHVHDAWLDRDKDKTGYEINFNRYFYNFKAPRPLAEIDAALASVEKEILDLMTEDAG